MAKNEVLSSEEMRTLGRLLRRLSGMDMLPHERAAVVEVGKIVAATLFCWEEDAAPQP